MARGTLVGVYGSLRRAHHNHHFLAGAISHGEATFGPGRMFSLGSYPAAVSVRTGGYPIVIEVYEVDGPTLARLDRLEGHPSFYRREQVVASLKDGGEELVCWVYLMPPSHLRRYEGDPTSYAEVVGGDWTAAVVAELVEVRS